MGTETMRPHDIDKNERASWYRPDLKLQWEVGLWTDHKFWNGRVRPIRAETDDYVFIGEHFKNNTSDMENATAKVHVKIADYLVQVEDFYDGFTMVRLDRLCYEFDYTDLLRREIDYLTHDRIKSLTYKLEEFKLKLEQFESEVMQKEDILAEWLKGRDDD